MLARAGVPLIEAQKLLGHSDPKLTAALYTHLHAEDLRGAVNRLPTFEEPEPEAKRDAVGAESGSNLATGEAGEHQRVHERARKSRPRKGVSASDPERARTSDLRFRRPLLYL